MYDNDMTNILKNFSNATSGTGTVVDAITGEQKVSNAAVEKNAMKTLLEGLDSQQKSVNQMPSTHTMAKNTDTAHPASKFLVGGEFDDDGWSPEPEWFNEPVIKPGVQVHIGHHTKGGSGVEGRVVKVSDEYVYIKNDDGQTYKGQIKNTTVSEAAVEEDTISKRETPKPAMKKKQSLADVFRSMEETEEDMASRFKKELHGEKTQKELSKGNNGKFDLAERFYDGEELSWGDELLEDLKLLLHDAESADDVVRGIADLIQQYEA